jgi:hypothetical protein
LHVGRGANPTAPEAGALPETGRFRAIFQKSKSKRIWVFLLRAPASFCKNDTPFVVFSVAGRVLKMKPAFLVAMLLAGSTTLFAADKEKPKPPFVIPVTGAGQSTTTKLGNSYVTRAGGQSFTTSQLGSSTITRDSKGNTWTTTKVGNSFVTRGPGGQQQTTSKLGNSFVTRDSKTGSTLTTSPVGNSFQTRGNSGASWSTSQLGSSLVTRGSSSSAKKDEKATRVIVIPSSK